jgi:hypothetical protein
MPASAMGQPSSQPASAPNKRVVIAARTLLDGKATCCTTRGVIEGSKILANRSEGCADRLRLARADRPSRLDRFPRAHGVELRQRLRQERKSGRNSSEPLMGGTPRSRRLRVRCGRGLPTRWRLRQRGSAIRSARSGKTCKLTSLHSAGIRYRHHRRAALAVFVMKGGVVYKVRGKIGCALSLWFSVFRKITKRSLDSSVTAATSRQLTAQDRATTLFIGCEV